jgi:hypothetical protein
LNLADDRLVATLALVAEINTGSAGFVNTPYYTARIVGDRVISTVSDGAESVVLLDTIVTILPGAGPKNFTLRALLIGQPLSGQAEVTVNEDLIGHWKVEWMAVEA